MVRKVYLSGRISGLRADEAKRLFAQAEEEVMALYPRAEVVNPLRNGVSRHAPWERHMLRDLELLSSCCRIYMLRNWRDSQGAVIEHLWAKRLGIGRLYQGKRRKGQ